MKKKLYLNYIAILAILIWVVVFLPYIYQPEVKLEKIPVQNTVTGEIRLVICYSLNMSRLSNVTQWRARWHFKTMLNSSTPNNRTVNFTVYPNKLNVTYIDIVKINDSSSWLNFTPTNDDIGMWNITVTASDGWCSAEEKFSIEIIFRNSAPVLNRSVSNVTWQQDRSISPYLLTDFFYDPENDPMHFWAEQPSRITIAVDNVTSRVAYSPQIGWYGVRYTVFHACDPWDCNISNIVTLNVTPVKYPPPQDQREATGRYMCQEYWVCSEWGECVDEFQNRTCIDTGNCGTLISTPHSIRACQGLPPPPVKEEEPTPPKEERPEETGPTCREIARRPWFTMLGFLLLAVLTEIYTYHARKRKAGRIVKSFIPYLISMSFVVLAMSDYLGWICACPQDCAAVPWDVAIIVIAAVVAVLLLIRMRWYLILKGFRILHSKIIRRRKETKDMLKLRLIELEIGREGAAISHKRLADHMRAVISEKFGIRYNFLIEELDIRLIDEKVDSRLRNKIIKLLEDLEKDADEKNVRKLIARAGDIIEALDKKKEEIK